MDLGLQINLQVLRLRRRPRLICLLIYTFEHKKKGQEKGPTRVGI